MMKKMSRAAKPKADGEYLAREIREIKRISYASLVLSLAAVAFVAGVMVRHFLG